MLREGVKLGPYSIIHSIGGTAESDSYLAESKRDTQKVVIKIFKDALPSSEEAVEETEDTSQVFMKEARILSELRHPDILQPLDYGKALIETQVHLYLATRFCPDENLADVMKMHHFSPREIASLVEQIATVLQYAHERSIIHRHVKPSNVFVQSSNETLENLDDARIFITDFFPEVLATENGTKTGDEQSRLYLAPEQLAAHAVYATDQYALAIITEQMLRNVLFTATNAMKAAVGTTQQVAVDEQPTKMSAVSGSDDMQISEEIATVLQRASAQKPEDRYPSISAFVQAFKESVEHGYTNTTIHEDVQEKLPPGIDSAQTVNADIFAETETETVRGNDIYVQVPLTRGDARRGTTCKVTLPEGRSVTVPIPPRTRNGQVIRLPEQGEIPHGGGTPGALIVTVITEDALDANSFLRRLNNLPRSRMTVLTAASALILFNIIALLIIGGVNRTAAFNQAYADITATARVHANIAAGIASNATAQSQATATFLSKHFPFSNTVGLDDPLSDASRDYGWPVGSNCKFDNGAYHTITPDANTYYYCEASNKAFSNFAFQVQLVVSKGDCGGITFHDNSSQPYLYLFLVCQDGTYQLDLVKNGNITKTISHASPMINKGTGQPNLIAVVVNADTISLYANNQLLDSLQDSVYNRNYRPGLVGLIAFPLNNTTEDIYSNAKVWVL